MATDNDFRNVLYALSIGYVFIWVYLMYPYSETLYSFFPFHSQLLSKQAYMDYLSWRAFLCLMFALFWYLSVKADSIYKKEFFYSMLLWFGFMIDYMLMYNDPGYYLTDTGFTTEYPKGKLFVPIGYPLAMGFGIFIIVIKAIRK